MESVTLRLKHKSGQKSVHLQSVGASDTAGYCVDGTPDTSDQFLLLTKVHDISFSKDIYFSPKDLIIPY